MKMFTTTKTRKAAINQNPAAIALVKVDGGYQTFESHQEIKVWENNTGRALPKTAYVDYKRPTKKEVKMEITKEIVEAVPAQEATLPALTGSEKQIAWAETIRQSKIDGIKKMLETLENAPKGTPLEKNYQKGVAAVKGLMNESSSKFWIDTRNNEFGVSWLVHQIKKSS